MERTIQDLLDKMKRRELADLGFRLSLPPPGGRDELPAWRRMAAEALPTLGPTVRECLGYQGLTRLRRCLRAAAEAGTPLFIPRALARRCGAQSELMLLRQLALCCQDRQGFHLMPCLPGMTALARGERALLEASDDLFVCIRGYLMHYGMLPLAEAHKLVTGVEDERTETVVLAVHARRCGLAGVVFMGNSSIWLCLPELADPSQLAAEVLRPDRRLVPYAACTEEAARQAMADGVTGDRALLSRLVEVGRICGTPRAQMLADAALAESFYQDEERDFALDTLLMHIDDQRLAVGELLADRYLNTVPVWHVKGHTVLETRAERPAAKVGWYAPCPCGSGRQWGQCCGKGN